MKFKKSAIVLVFLVFFYGNAFGMIMGNDSCVAFLNSNCTTGGSSGTNQLNSTSIEVSLSQLIVDAAGFYLQSNSHFQNLLKKVELAEFSGVNKENLLVTTEEAIYFLENSRATYKTLLEEANKYKYNPKVVAKLKKFDYDMYLKENSLIPSIFQDAEDILSEGDVKKFYKQMIHRIDKIIDALYLSRNKFVNGEFPDTTHFWRINQMFLQTELFGQYVAEIFMNL